MVIRNDPAKMKEVNKIAADIADDPEINRDTHHQAMVVDAQEKITEGNWAAQLDGRSKAHLYRSGNRQAGLSLVSGEKLQEA
jgi:hypothetical protein